MEKIRFGIRSARRPRGLEKQKGNEPLRLERSRKPNKDFAQEARNQRHIRNSSPHPSESNEKPLLHNESSAIPSLQLRNEAPNRRIPGRNAQIA